MLSEQDCVRYVKKFSFGVFLGAKSTRLLLQKHANRTVHPLKIEGVLPMVQRLLHVFQRPLFWFPKTGFGASKQYPTSMFFGTCDKVVILGLLGVSWRSNLRVFWRASRRNTAAQLLFFVGSGHPSNILLFSGGLQV